MMTTVVGLDIGTSTVTCVVGEVGRGRARVLGVGIVPASGVKKGRIVDAVAAEERVVAAVDMARRTADFPLQDCWVSVAGPLMTSTNSSARVAITGGDGLVRREDVVRAIEAARLSVVPARAEVLQALPTGYWVDGVTTDNPVGMDGLRLEARTHIITMPATALQTIAECAGAAGLVVRGFIPSPLAAADALLHLDEREMGVALIDVGAGTTDIAVFREGVVRHTASLPIGGDHFTADLAVALECSQTVAEQIKIQSCVAPQLTSEGAIETDHLVADRRFIAEVLAARALDIFSLIYEEIQAAGGLERIPGGIVFCGGTAQMTGWETAARELFGPLVRVAEPHALPGMFDRLRVPAQAVAAGLMRWAMREVRVRPPEPAAVSTPSIEWRELPAQAAALWQHAQRWIAPLLPDPQDA